MYIVKLIFFTFLLCSPIYAHRGGQVKSGPLIGCHHNQKLGCYHCHKKSKFNGEKWESKAQALNFIKKAASIQANSPTKLQKIIGKKIPITEYERKQYPRWQDQDSDCQDTRAEILISSSKGDIKFKREKGFFAPSIATIGRNAIVMSNSNYLEISKLKRPCNVSHGNWYDPYSNKTFTKASDLDIDHIVPLEHAHYAGAYKLNRKQKGFFSNDPLNLIAVDKSLNRSKGSKAPEKWLPPNTNFHCEYAKRWEAVKKKYGLTMSEKEKVRIMDLKKSCGK